MAGKALDVGLASRLVWNWVAFLNAARAEPGVGDVCLDAPTAAQQRCLDSFFRRAIVFLAEVPSMAFGGVKQLDVS